MGKLLVSRTDRNVMLQWGNEESGERGKINNAVENTSKTQKRPSYRRKREVVHATMENISPARNETKAS